MAFLFFMLFAVQLLMNLYATSTINAAGLDAARSVASRNVNHFDPAAIASAQTGAEARFRALLGSAADGAELSWSIDQQTVRLHVQMRPPTILPTSLGHRVAFSEVSRTYEVQVEELQ